MSAGKGRMKTESGGKKFDVHTCGIVSTETRKEKDDMLVVPGKRKVPVAIIVGKLTHGRGQDSNAEYLQTG